MCSILWTFLMLTCVALADIKINVRVGDNINEAFVHAVGEIREVIPEEERGAWRLLDWQLKDAAEKFSGGRPDDVYVRSPTPWNDLYETYGWAQVTRTLVPIAARIVSITNEPGIYVTEEVINNSNVSATFKSTISQQIDQTISTSWSVGGQLSLGHKIQFGVDFKVVSALSASEFTFTSEWGKEEVKALTDTVGLQAGTTVELPARHGAMAALSMSRATMEVQVDYQATLTGRVACNYRRTYQGHHFRSYEVNAVLRSVGSPTQITSREVLRIGFVSDVRITITDQTTSQLLYTSAPFLTENKVDE